MNRTAVIYARVSSASDRQSTDRQVADLRAFAQREVLEVVGEYWDFVARRKWLGLLPCPEEERKSAWENHKIFKFGNN